MKTAIEDIKTAVKPKRKLKTGIALLCAGAALCAFPFVQQAMQGSISNGDLRRINAASLQMDSASVFEGGGYSSGGGNAVTFRDMSNNMVTASSGFNSLAGLFGGGSSAPTPVTSYVQPSDFQPSPYYRDTGRDSFPAYESNAVKSVRAEPVSTFSLDVDTASYSFVRRALKGGRMPSASAVRVEELVNYFPYDYEAPKSKEVPFLPTVAVYKSPWKADRQILHIGIKGYALAEKPRSNLVFLIDTSGSMHSPDKLPMVVSSLKMLIGELNPDDTVGIVTYAGRAGVALEPVRAAEKDKIVRALDSLYAGGSTAGADGLRSAYELAEKAFIKEGNNRVILATDGDFNVGISRAEDLKDYIATKRDKGVFLSVLGYGIGNYHDSTMQALAQEGNGNAAYIDDLSEARKVLVEEASSTLFAIAKDVKVQVEFNPAQVLEYRLIGYETRKLNREDFKNDKVDAGEVGAGHSVTAIYEITPAGTEPALPQPRYDAAGAEAKDPPEAFSGELAFLKLRYKRPEGDTSTLMTRPVTTEDVREFDALPDDMRFASAVAGFGQMLTGGKHLGADYGWDDIEKTARNARGKDLHGYRSGFVSLLGLAKSVSKTSNR